MNRMGILAGPGRLNRSAGANFDWRRIAGSVALSFAESNRNSNVCELYLITQPIDDDYKNYLIFNLLINI
jgi:hypothetical protein